MSYEQQRLLKQLRKQAASKRQSPSSKSYKGLGLIQFVREILKPKLAITPFHEEWYGLAEDQSIKELLILAPREHAKSTCLSVFYPVWLLSQSPDTRILVVSKTDDQAELFVGEAVQWLTRLGLKPRFPSRWTKREIVISRNQILKDPSVVGVGSGSSIEGRRADIIICDDLCNEDNSNTEYQRHRLKNWFQKSLLPTLMPGGKIIIIGTRWAYNDLYSDLIDSGLYTSRVYTCLQNNVKDVDSPDARPLWPELFSLEELRKRRDQMGMVNFNCQFLNDPSGVSGAYFDRTWLRHYVDKPIDYTTYMSVDPAISPKRERDYFVICTIGVTRDNDIYVLDLYRDHLKFDQQVEAIKKKYAEYNPRSIIIEAQAYQTALVQHFDNTLLPVLPVTQKGNKRERILSLSPDFQRGKILILKTMYALEEEYSKFPYGEHDDCLDALEMAVSEAKRKTFSVAGCGETYKPKPFDRLSD